MGYLFQSKKQQALPLLCAGIITPHRLKEKEK
jgi:hypothetical protein